MQHGDAAMHDYLGGGGNPQQAVLLCKGVGEEDMQNNTTL